MIYLIQQIVVKNNNKRLKYVIIIKVFHNILHSTMKDIAELINRIHFHIFIVLQSVDLGAVDIMVGI